MSMNQLYLLVHLSLLTDSDFGCTAVQWSLSYNLSVLCFTVLYFFVSNTTINWKVSCAKLSNENLVQFFYTVVEISGLIKTIFYQNQMDE